MASLIRSVLSLVSHQVRATPYSQAVIADHLRILEALEARDADRAREAVRRVIDSSATQLGMGDLAR
mgnify:CR=1 FL=1